jgi:hypothetical protein
MQHMPLPGPALGYQRIMTPSPLSVFFQLTGEVGTVRAAHMCRTFSQLILWRLLELRPSLPATDPSLAAMLAFFTANPDIQRLRAGLGAHLDTLELDMGATPRGVLGQVGRAAGGVRVAHSRCRSPGVQCE